MRTGSLLAPAGVALLSAVMGLATVIYVGWFGDSLVRIAALPLMIALMVMLVVDKRLLFLSIMLLRTIGDPIFDAAKFSIGGLSIGVGAVLNGLIICIALLFMLDQRAPKMRLHVPRWTVLALLLLLGSVFRSPDHASALRTFLVLVSYLAVFIIPFYMLQSAADIRFAIRIVLLSSILPALYAFVDLATHWGGGGPDGLRLRSSFSHPNIFAFYLLLVISLLLYRLKDEVHKLATGKRWLFVGYMFLLLGFLLLTKTRSAWLACFFIFGIYGIRFERRILFYLILVPLLALLIPEVRDRLLDLTASDEFNPYAQLNSFDWRLEIWKSGIGWMEPVSLLIGYGLNSFVFYSPTFFALAGNTNFAAHNVYVQWFFETGAIGVAFLFWVFYRLLRVLGQRMQSDNVGTTIMVSLALAYLVVCASDNMIDYLSFNWYFWFICGTLCSVATFERRIAQEHAFVPTIKTTLMPMTAQQRRRLLLGGQAGEGSA
jgi:O-antigen ligase